MRWHCDASGPGQGGGGSPTLTVDVEADHQEELLVRDFPLPVEHQPALEDGPQVGQQALNTLPRLRVGDLVQTVQEAAGTRDALTHGGG
jgi:hypothetical protein